MSPRAVLFPVANDQWRRQMEDARAIDREAVAKFGQRDRCHHFCAMQRQQQRDGFLMVEIATNMFGYVVRDTMNDGLGSLYGGRSRKGTTRAEAIEWARQWHSERPTHREVILGFEGAVASSVFLPGTAPGVATHQTIRELLETEHSNPEAQYESYRH